MEIEMNYVKYGVPSLLLLLIGGCASVTTGEYQTVQFAARDSKSNVLDAVNCEWKNSREAGSVLTPGTARIKRDYDALHVVCRKEGFAPGMASVNSKAQSAMAGNILAGGVIGAAVDHSTGNAYEYPPVITVRMGDAIQIDPQKYMRGQRQTAQGHKDIGAIPAPSGYASISDVGSIPTSSQGCRDIYSRYLGLASPKAMAFSVGGGCASRTGPDAIDAAIQGCARDGTRRCALYAVDNDVVWVKP
jgi:hypothetical protein